VTVRKLTCSTTGATSCSINGLPDGHEYLARVRAINAIGTGKASRPAHFVAGQSPDCSNFTPGADLRYCRFGSDDLNGDDLAGADLSGARYGTATFVGTDLDGAIFDQATDRSVVEAADFSGAQLVGAQFAGMYIESTDFSGTDLTDATFDGTTLVDDDFADAVMTGADLNAVWSADTCPDGTLSDADGNTCANNLDPSTP
jgi:uncharacterized protein YjbI with pentapeptide repeats